MFAVTWTCMVVAYVAVPTWAPYLMTAIGVVSVAAVLCGIWIHRPATIVPWVMVAIALIAFVIGDSIYSALTVWFGQDNPFPSLADASYLLTYFAFAAALLIFTRRMAAHRDRAVILDALIVTVGMGLLAWIYLIGPYVTADDLGVMEKAVSIAYPLGDVLLLVLLLRLVLSVPHRPTSLLLLTAGTGALLTVDVVYGLGQLNGTWQNGGNIDVLWFVCYGLWTAAALHPSMADLTVRQATTQSELRWSRLAMIGAAGMISPAVLLHRAVAGRSLEMAEIAVFSGVLFALVLTRLITIVRQQRSSVEREQALRQASGDLARATTRMAIKTVVGQTLPRLAGSTMTYWLILRDEFEANEGDSGALATAYGREPRGRVVVPRSTLRTATEPTKDDHVHILPVTSSDSTELLGLLCVADRADVLVWLDAALEILASQVALAIVRVAQDNETVSRRSAEHFRALIQNASDVIVVLNETNRVTYATPSVRAMFGRSPEDLLGRPVFGLLHERSRMQARVALSRLRERGHRAQDLDDWQVVADGDRLVEAEVFLADLRDVEVIDGVVLTMRDVTSRRQLERELTYRAFHDPLTGLANRVLFNDRTEQALRRCRRTQTMAAVFFCDLDDFKDVNDLLGHSLGDQVLREVASRIGEIIRPADTAARLGGDEFAILAEDLGSMEDIETLGERLVDGIREPYLIGGESITLSVSVGISTSADGRDSTEMLRWADLALYAAKDAGKQTWRVFAPQMQAAVAARIELRADLEAALRDGDFRLAYQPLVALETNQATGVEALVRWEHRRNGLLRPDVFLSVAEDTGLIVPLGAWVLRTALHEARDWRLADGSRPHLHVNVSARQLQIKGFPEVVRQGLADTGFPAGCLVLELTESLFLDDDNQSRGAIAELKTMGVRLAMDDFGTGYSSLGYLRNFPVDLLKIDKAFVSGLAVPSQRALVDAIVRIARVLELDLIAEGIEDSLQREILLELGCSVGQGYYYSHPEYAAMVPLLLAGLLPLPRPETDTVIPLVTPAT